MRRAMAGKVVQARRRLSLGKPQRLGLPAGLTQCRSPQRPEDGDQRRRHHGDDDGERKPEAPIIAEAVPAPGP
jgi:hypothetical protein